jgi:acyl dehydratase
VVEEGQKFEVERQFTAEDVASYVQLSGDTNPIHTSDSAAQAAGFQRPVVQGMLYAGLFPAVIGSHFVSNLVLPQTLWDSPKTCKIVLRVQCKTCTVQIAQTASKSENLEYLCALKP